MFLAKPYFLNYIENPLTPAVDLLIAIFIFLSCITIAGIWLYAWGARGVASSNLVIPTSKYGASERSEAFLFYIRTTYVQQFSGIIFDYKIFNLLEARIDLKFTFLLIY